MKRASYRHGIEWVALNDGAGDDDALDPLSPRFMLTVVLLADLFGVETERVAADVVRFRKRMDAGEAAP